MEYRLKDRIAVVIGRSSGIGFATVTLLLGEGARVAFCGRDSARLDAAMDKLIGRYGRGRILSQVADVCRTDGMSAYVRSVENAFGGADILINKAGQGRMSGFAETTDEAWRAELDLKFFSIIYATRAFLPLLEKDRDPAIVCTNALLAVRPEAHTIATSPLASFIIGTALDVSGGQADHV